MIDPIENSPEENRAMEGLIERIARWSVTRMNELTYNDRVDDATSIYFEFEEWLDPASQNEVVILDDMAFESLSEVDDEFNEPND